MAMRWATFAVAVVFTTSCFLGQVRSDASDHRYKAGDAVPLYANKVGPFHNPSETYRYFDLPFCVPEHVKEKREALGEVLNGDRLVSAPYKLDFLVDKDSEVICKKRLTREAVEKFREAVSKDYYFQMYYDDLPIWGFLGKVDKEGKAEPGEFKFLLYKHVHFDVYYNKDRVIEINVRTDPNTLVDNTEDREIDVEFMYTVKWKETNTPFDKRMDKYSQSSSLPHHLEIHWFSIINSCVTVLLLTGFLATILMRVLKNDFVKYAHDEEAAQITQHNNLQFNVPRQMQPLQQPHQLQTSSAPAHALSSHVSQIRHNIVNQTLTPPQAHSQIPQTPATAQMQNTLQNTSPLQNIQLQRSIVNQSLIQQQPVFDASWHSNNMVASNPPKQCNPLSQVTSNQAQFELLQKFEQHQQSLLPQQSTFQQPSQSTQIQDLQKPNISQRFCSSVVPTQSQQMPKIQNQQPRLMMSDIVQDHVGIASNSITNHLSIIEEYNTPNVAVNQSNNVCDFMAPSSAVALNGKGVETMATNANPVKDFHQKSSIKPLVESSKPPNQEDFFEQQTNYHSVQGSHLDYLDTCSAASVKEASNISSGGLITNYENCNYGQQELSSSMVTHSFGVPDLAFNSIDSDTQFLNQGAWVPPPLQYQPRMRTYTKVYKRGAVGGSIDVTRYSGYDELKQDLARRFGIVGQLEDRGRVGWKLVYVDHENDVLLVGDDPWEEFIRCVRCIKILSTQEVQQMSLDREQSNLVLPNQAGSSSDGGNM